MLSVITGGGKWVEILPMPIRSISILLSPRKEVLALCRERRGAKTLWHRAAKAADRGGAGRRYDRFQCLGGVRRHLCRDPVGPS